MGNDVCLYVGEHVIPGVWLSRVLLPAAKFKMVDNLSTMVPERLWWAEHLG